MPFGTVSLPRRRGISICPEHHGPTAVCAHRRHRQYRRRRAQFAVGDLAAVPAPDPAPALALGRSAPPEPAPATSIAVTPQPLVGDLMAGCITAGNIGGYTITWGPTTAAANYYGGNTATYASSTVTMGNWVMIPYDARPLADDAVLRPGRSVDGLYHDSWPLVETDEQRAARLEAALARRERWDREQAARRERDRLIQEQTEAARGRARALLLSLLDDAQRAEFETAQTITLVGSAGNRFRLTTTHIEGNVSWLADDGSVRGRMCAHPARYHDDGGVLPVFDIIAGQVLALRTDEPAFVGVANRYEGELPTYPPRTPAVPDAAEESEAA